MNSIIRYIIKILPNAVIILCIMLITIWILDIYNPGMNFLGNDISNKLLFILFALSLINGIVTIVLDRKSK